MTTTDPITMYLQTLEDRARRLKEKFETTETPEDFEAWCRADTNLKSERLECLGVTCPLCDGEGEITVGVMPAGMYSPPEGVVDACHLCKGECAVLPETAERWKENHEE